MTGAFVIPAPVPIDIGADPARELAERELARAVYVAEEPPLPQRILDWLGERLDDLLRAAGSVSAGGAGGVLVVVLLLVLVAVLVRWRLGRVARAGAQARPVLGDAVRTADEHRRLAEEAAAAGRHDEAVREMMRALVRGLEERAVLDPRAGRTAGEVAREVRAALPVDGPGGTGGTGGSDAAGGVEEAARLFDETVYGGRPADAAAVDRIRAADAALRRTRVVPAA